MCGHRPSYDDLEEKILRLEHLREVNQSLFDSAPDGICIIRPDGIILDVNPAYAKMTGYSRKDLIRKSVAEMIPPEHRIDLEAFKQRVEAGGVWRLESVHLRKDGTLFPIEVRGALSTVHGKPALVGIIRDITEYKRDQAALRESEQFYRNLLNDMVTFVAVLKTDGEVVFVNNTPLKAAGMTLEEIIGKKFWDVYWWAYSDKASQTIAHDIEQCASGKTLVHDIELQTADGSLMWIEFSMHPILDKSGRVQYLIPEGRDISARKQAEKELNEYRLVVDSSDDLIVSTDTNLVLKFANETFFNYLQKEKYEIIGRTIPEVAGNAFFEKLLKPYILRALQGEHLNHESLVRYPILGKRFMNFHYVPVKHSTTQKITGVAFLIRDQTAEYTLKQEQAQLALAIEQSDDSIVVTDKDGTIRYVNPAFEQTTGYLRREVIGQNPRILKSGRHDETFYMEMWNTLTSGKTWKGELENKRKDRTFFTEQASISPVVDRSGNIINYVAVKRDVTKQRAIQQQLNQSQKMEAIGLLAGGVAHDFNNMLGVIIGYAEIAISRLGPDDPLLNNLQEIYKAGKRSADITRQLLAFSRKQTIKPVIVELHQLIPSLIKTIGRLIGEDIDIVFIPGKDLWKIMFDPAQIDQIMVNLAVNARDAMLNGGKLTIETANITFAEGCEQKHPGLVPGQYVMITVSDNGTGMDQENLSHIFEPFFTTKVKGQGTGLGLATVYGIVKQNKGFIDAYSEPGHGTKIKVYIPRGVEAYKEEEEPDKAFIPSGTETILLVEDDRRLVQLVRKMLEVMGYTVLLAETPHDALTLFNKHENEIHLLLSDVIMPRMNGKELSDSIKARKPGIKTLFMSGYTAEIISRHGVLEKGTDYIQKPFTHSELAIKVREALEQ